jgi:hypothetical protein
MSTGKIENIVKNAKDLVRKVRKWKFGTEDGMFKPSCPYG